MSEDHDVPAVPPTPAAPPPPAPPVPAPLTPEPPAGWEPALPPAAPPRGNGLAGWALTFSVIALAASVFVGWALPLGVVGVIVAIVALRRPMESRPVAVWALVLGAVSVLYSAGWLVWATAALGWWGAVVAR